MNASGRPSLRRWRNSTAPKLDKKLDDGPHAGSLRHLPANPDVLHSRRRSRFRRAASEHGAAGNRHRSPATSWEDPTARSFRLSWEERVELVRFTRRHASDDRLVIGGSGMHSTQSTIEMTRAMAEAGAGAALVVTPSYYKSRMDAPALTAYYTQVADAAPIPIILYNVPANTSIDMPAGTILELSAHPNIIGLKDSSGNVAKLGEICNSAGDSFQVLSGSASSFLGAMAMGAVGAVSALANIAPEPLHRIWSVGPGGGLPGGQAAPALADRSEQCHHIPLRGCRAQGRHGSGWPGGRCAPASLAAALSGRFIELTNQPGEGGVDPVGILGSSASGIKAGRCCPNSRASA